MSVEDGAEKLIGRTIGAYPVEELLGRGGFAWVFSSRPAGGGDRVALKILKPRYSGDKQFEQRFSNEIEVAAALDHPNIVKIIEFGHADGFTFFAMELYPNSLASVLDKFGTLEEPVLHTMAMDVASGLSTAHAAGVIHRDLKVENIMFRGDGTAVLTDFGIARAISGYVAATGANMTIGTPHYVSPEQAQGRSLDGRSDLYAFGVTLYKAATGELPFKSTDWFELARMHVEVTPERPRKLRPELSKRFERIILKCLAKHPDDRYESADSLLDELKHISDKQRMTANFGGTLSITALPGKPKETRNKLKLAVQVLAILGLLALLATIAVL